MLLSQYKWVIPHQNTAADMITYDFNELLYAYRV
jgi:hypothetical protein